MIRLLLLSLFPLGLLAAPAADTAAFRQQIVADLTRAVERSHTQFARAGSSRPVAGLRGQAWMLSALTDLHRATGDARFLTWTKEDLLAMVDQAQDARGQAIPFVVSFRNLPPFCMAVLYLRERGLLDAEQLRRVSAQVSASVATHYPTTDFGAQNRGLIDAAGFYFAAAVVPADPDVAKWRGYGAALAADSWNAWSIEDASIYQPFWLNYTLTLSDLLGTSDAHLRAVTTRFYFDQAKALQLPNGLLPDWGDGDWTHSWAWNFANFVRAASQYRDGTYLEAARRLYTAALAYWGELQGDELYSAGLALRWLDATVPLAAFTQDQSAEVVDDLVSKKIVFRSASGAYALLNYRDEGPFALYQRDYQRTQLAAEQEKPHHGHADENSIALLMDAGTVLLADGGYRATFERGWRADIFHNRIVARTGFPAESDVFDYLRADATYHSVRTEKIHFGNFGSLDYARTRLVDAERGYTGDRLILFAPGSGLTIVVDSILNDTTGAKVFCNTWHPDKILQQGASHVVSRPDRIPIRKEYWPNPPTRELLIQFLGNRDKVTQTREIQRRYNPSQAFYQYLQGTFFKGQRLTFVTVLRSIPSGAFLPAMLEDVTLLTDEHDDGRTLGLRFTLDGDPVTVALKLDQTIGLTNLRGRPMFDWRTGAVSYGALRTDADFAFVRERRDRGHEFGFLYGCALEHAGRTLFNMPLNREMYQGQGDFRVPEIKDKMPRWHAVAPAP